MNKKSLKILGIIILIFITGLCIGSFLPNQLICNQSKTGYINDIEWRVYPGVGYAEIFIKYNNETGYVPYRLGDNTQPFCPPEIAEGKVCKVTWYDWNDKIWNRMLVDIEPII